MFNNVSEQTMHRVRWLLTLGWLLLIAVQFYDPLSPWLTDPSNNLSPLRLETGVCVKVQGVCLVEQPYPVGARLFWATIVPCSIIILLVFGHELWRRICPLSFVSQLPRALGIQRRSRKAKIKQNSWLGRNYLYFQFALFYLGLCVRILFVNTVGWALGSFLLLTISAAILVGYLYEGKSWCNYFCPMAPVQKIYSEPGGLLTSAAHTNRSQTITQSMCRVVDTDGKEQSACVACQTPCIDIDAERTYWDSINRPDRQLLSYGYIGLVFSFYFYYYLYAGNWDYYFSGAWTHEEKLLSNLFAPGFYLFETPIPIPKLVAVPLTLGGFGVGSYWLGLQGERLYKIYLRRRGKYSQELLRHRMFTLATAFVFNLFFWFGGRPMIRLLPPTLQTLFTVICAVLSGLWLSYTWKRSPEQYQREKLADLLRRQLGKLHLSAEYLEGRSLDQLDANEIYILAKVLPRFTKAQRFQAYKGVLQEALEEGYVQSASSLEVLKQLRLELDMSDRDHQTLLTELGIEEPSLFDPQRQRTREDWARLQGFRHRLQGLVKPKRRRSAKGLGRELLQVVTKEKSLEEVFVQEKAWRSLSREYALTPAEQAEILADLSHSAKHDQ
ncbi:MAG: calcium-binding protein [Cyanophyceae cyanobacterium]